MSIKRLVPLNTVSLTADPSNAVAGDIYYNSTSSQLRYFNGTSWVILAGSVNALVDAKSIYQDVRNQSGVNLPIATPVYVSGSLGASNKILISTASNASEATSSKTMGITTSSISDNSNGQVISEGLLEGIDTTGAADGDPVWLGVNGAKIYGLLNKPSAPAHLVFLGIVVRGGSATTGSMYVKIQNGFELQEIHNVELSSLVNGNILAYDSTTQTWKNTNTLQSTSSTVPLVIKGSVSQTADLQQWQDSAGIVKAYVRRYGQFISGDFTNAQLSITGQFTNNPVAVIRGVASQTANLQEWQNSAGTVLTSISSGGNLVVGATGTLISYASGRGIFALGDPASVGLTVKAAASQTANLQEWQNSTGTVLANIFADGDIGINSIRSVNGSVKRILMNQTTESVRVTTATAAYIGLVIRGVSGQTADLQQWQDSAGTVLSEIDAAGAANFVRAGIGGITPSTTPLFVTSPNASYIATIIRGASGQSANLQEWQNSAGSVQASMSPFGQIRLNSVYNISSFNNAQVNMLTTGTQITSNVAANVILSVKGAASQTANLQEWQDSAGTVLAKITSDGSINTSGPSGIYSTYGFSSAGGLSIGNGVTGIYVHSTYGMGIQSASGNVTDPTLVIKLGSVNQTGSLQEWHSSTGTVLANVSSAGRINAPQFGSTQSGKAYVNTGTSADSNSWTFVTNSASNKGIVIVGASSQTANLQEWQNNSGQVRAKIDSYGGFSSFATTQIGNDLNGSGTSLIVYTKDAAGIPIVIKGFTSQVADLQQWQNSSNTVLAKIAASGQIYNDVSGTEPIVIKSAGSTRFELNQYSQGWSDTAFTFGSYYNTDGGILPRLSILNGNAGGKGLIVRGFTSQTANLQEWQDISGNVLASISSTGGFTVPSLTVSGDFTVNGTTTNINTTNLIVEDKNITIADVATPTDTTADGAGITIKGATDKTLNWVQSTGSFTSSDPFIINTTSTTKQNLIVKAIASQTANLTEWQDSTGYLISKVDSSGSLWINAAPATSGSVETSSAYLYLTSNRWSGSASTPEVFGLNNFRFGGAGAAGAFALHLKPASSSNAYLSIAGDSSRSVGVNVQYPSASSGYGQFGVQIQNASYKGVVVKAATSQSANLQEWQNSSGGVDTAVTSTGRLSVRTTLADAGLNVGTPSASTIGQIIRGAASQTANLQQWQDSAGSLVAWMGFDGRTYLAYSMIGTWNLDAMQTIYSNSASRVGSVIRSAASSTVNLQEWQNSSGTVLSAIDASGSFTSVSQPIQVAGSTYGFSKLITADLGATSYWKIATLPSSNLGTYDQINIDAMLGGWASTGKTRYEIMLGNRDAFAYKYTKFGDGLTQARIQSYVEADGSVSVYLYSENTFTTLSYNITLSTAGVANGATIYKNPTASTTAPTGTKVFDTGEPATYIPLINMNNAGLLSAKNGAFTSTSTSAVTLTVQSAASQTANIQEWKNNAGTTAYLNTNLQYYNPGRISVLDANFSGILSIFSGNPAATVSIFRGAASQTADLAQWQNSSGTTYLNVTNAGTMISNGGVTIASNPTINAYGAAMKIASGVSSYPMLILQAAASQTADIQQWQNSGATVIASIDSYGNAGFGGVGANSNQGLYVKTNSNPAVVGIIVQGASSQTADLQQWKNSSGTTLAKVDANGNFSAISKSFDIPHPTKENMRLRYASLEGNEHGVYVRGTTKEKFIELPEYWTELVDESTITVSLTSVGKFQKVYVEKIEGNKIYIGGRVKEISYAVFGERKDIDKLTVEY